MFNLLLGDKISYYQENSKILHNTPAKYKDKYPFLREVDSLALTNSQINLDLHILSKRREEKLKEREEAKQVNKK